MQDVVNHCTMMNKNGAKVSPCRMPAFMSMGSVSPSGERTVEVLLV